MNAFRTGLPARAAHAAMLGAVQTMERAKQNAVLWFGEIVARKLYQDLGYGSIYLYAEQELGFSKTRTGDFLLLCKKLEALPRVKEKLESGELGYTPARVLVQVADPASEERWLAEAERSSRRELEMKVKLARRAAAEAASGQLALVPHPAPTPPAAMPVRVALEMTPVQFARYEALLEQVRRLGTGADRVETLLEALACYVEECPPRGGTPAAVSAGDSNETCRGEARYVERDNGKGSAGKARRRQTSRPPFQIHIHQCPDCARATVPTSRGELPLSAAELARARCDGAVCAPGGRNSATIPPAVRRQALARHRHRCSTPGCGHTRHLEVHHVVPRARGGGHNLANLTVLCSACHRLLHEGRLRLAKTG